MPLIDVNELKAELFDSNWVIDNDEHMVEEIIERQPYVDAEPVRHAKWVHMEDYESPIYSTWMCNSCKGKVYMSLDDSPDTHGFTYCPMCGARMDGGTNNADS